MTDEPAPTIADEPESRPGGLPLYFWVLGALAMAVPLGLVLGLDASRLDAVPGPARAVMKAMAGALDLAPRLIIQALKALAAPLVVLAILSAIVTNEIRGRQGARMMGVYLINTLAAMIIGLALCNLIEPGKGASLGGAATAGGPRVIDVLLPRPAGVATPPASKTLVDILVEMVPKSIADAFVTNNLAQLVLVTLAVGIALTRIRDEQRRRGDDSYLVFVRLVSVGFEVLMRVLLWVVALVPLAVLGVVAITIGREGFGLFLSLGWFIASVLIGLALQVTLYLIEVGLIGRITPWRFLAAAGDVMAMTFSTASTAATIPITLRALTENLGLSRANSQLAACIGTNFNNDGTALYQASAALFFAQALGADLPLSAQIVVVLTTLVASVGAGGIPSGSFVTMPLIFAAVDLPIDRLPILLTIDWFLDRCRTTSNVLGDMTVAVVLERTDRAR